MRLKRSKVSNQEETKVVNLNPACTNSTVVAELTPYCTFKTGEPKWMRLGRTPASGRDQRSDLLQAEKERGNSSHVLFWQWSGWWNSPILSLHFPKWDKPTGYVLMTAKRTWLSKLWYWDTGALSSPLVTQIKDLW